MTITRTILLCVLCASVVVPAAFASVAMNGGTITITDDAVLSIGSSEAWTLSMWVKPGGASTSWRNLFLWRAGTDSGDAALRLAIQGSGTWPPSCLYGHFPTNGTPHVDDKKAYTGNETGWCRVTMSRGDDLKIRLYSYKQGGSEILAYTSASTYTQALNVAANLVLGGSTFNGKLAEVAFWKRELSSAERAALDAGGLPGAATGGAPDWNLPLFDDYSVETDNLTVSDTSTTSLDGPDHPIDRGDTAPFAVTMVWPKTGDTVNYQTRIMWTKTPADATQEQTFDVYIGKTSPPGTKIGDAISVLYCDTEALDENSTYYVRVDATTAGGTTAGAIQQFSTFNFPDHTYFVTPGGTGNGATPATAMGWSGIGDTESDAAIILISPDATIFYPYESAHPNPYVEWPDRAYYTKTLTEFAITRTFQDYRRVFRFIDGSYATVGKTVIVSYDPPFGYSASAFPDGGAVGRVINGMMVNPTGTGSGLDAQVASGWVASAFSAAANRGDELPFMVDTFPSSVLNCYSMDYATDPEPKVEFRYSMRSVSVLTVVETALANNTWFRPPYRAYTGRAVEYQWSDVVTARIPQVALGGTRQLLSSAGETRSLKTESFTSLERIVTRPTMELATVDAGSRCHAWDASELYAGNWAKENGDAYLALFDSDIGTLEQKRRLLIGCIQRGLDLWAVCKQGQSLWWKASGGNTHGRYWPILFAGIVLDDAEMVNFGLATNQDIDDNWNLPNGFQFDENAQTFRITSNFLGSGDTFWDSQPYRVRAYPTLRDNTGTVSVTQNSSTVIGEAGETWGGAVAGDRFITTQTIFGTLRVLDEVRGYSTTAVAYTIQSASTSGTPTLTLTSPYQGNTATGVSFIIGNHLYLGRQYKVSDYADYHEFDESWEGVSYWCENPLAANPPYSWQWAISNPTYLYGGYHGIVTSSMIGFAVCPVIMHQNGGFPAVTSWNSPQFFEYFDWCRTNVGSGNWGNYTSGYAKGVILSNKWVYPPTYEYDPAPTVTKATTPTPADDATGVALGQVLSWTPGQHATRHKVYFGTVSENLSLAAGPQTLLTFTPVTEYSTTYYWRVDELDDGDQEITGDEWSFTTRAAPASKKIGLKKSE